MKKVEIYTDGACSGNPGKGGWGAVLIYNSKEKQFSGADPSTTNNRMELTAVIEALKALKEPCEVTLTTDSKYVCDAIIKVGFIRGKKKAGKKLTAKKHSMSIYGSNCSSNCKSTKLNLFG